MTRKIITPGQGARLIDQGWAAADLHVHTWFSYDVIPTHDVDPLTLYEKGRQMGFRFITFTDHDTMDAYDRVGWTRPGIVPGVEIKIRDPRRVGHTVHVNVYQLNRKQFRELERIAEKDQNIETFVSYLKANDLPYVYNHPFWHEVNETPDFQSIFDIAPLFPVLEYNRGRVNRLNLQAIVLAGMNNSSMVACTDSHIGQIGSSYTLSRGDTFPEYFKQIESGSLYMVPEDLTVNRLTGEVMVRIHGLFNKKNWCFDKPDFNFETGIKILDDLVFFLIHSERGNLPALKRAIKAVLQGMALSRLPAAIYIRTQQMLAEKIRRHPLADNPSPSLLLNNP